MIESFPYKISNKQELIQQMNNLGTLHTPFLFIIDYKAEQGYIIKQDDLDMRYVQFESQDSKQYSSINGGQRIENQKHEVQISKHKMIQWEILKIGFEDYRKKFEYVMEQIHLGNSFLTNLTQPSQIITNLSLLELYQLGSAKYKLWLNNKFTVLSPETFIRIKGRTISSYPMKGTIDASIPMAKDILLNDPKEKAEHATIVDLIRNDLSLVADNVEVKRYRYIEKLKTNKQDLLQVSSEIAGRLAENYLEKLGDILFTLLPAGSISGAPKPKTLEIIDAAEGYNRNFYTGICGWFDGKNLDSAVMIRYIEKKDDSLFFKSGGGITSQSNLLKEYEELIQKVYVPIY